MGRSKNSRNRVFVEKGGTVATQPFCESGITDPSLVIYTAARPWNSGLIIANGDQTDTISDFLHQGKTFEQALETRDYEPDAPHFTPRISALTETQDYKMSILRRSPDGATERDFWKYALNAGKGHFIHTYKTDGDPLPSFEGEPKIVGIPDDFGDFTRDIWENLDSANKISLFTCSIDIRTGEQHTKVINKHGGMDA
jgi:IMP cyclohydrolase